MGHGSATESVMTSSTDVVPRRATTTDLVPAADLGVCEAQLLQRCLTAGGNPIPLGELRVWCSQNSRIDAARCCGHFCAQALCDVTLMRQGKHLVPSLI